MRRAMLVLCIAAGLMEGGTSAPTAGGRTVAQASRAGGPQTAPRRIVSLVPALTETLFAIGAGSSVVAVSSFDTYPPEVKDLPRVGALLDPDTERILALRPDLVISYGSQSDAQSRFARAGIRVFSYRHGGIATVLETIRELGALTGRTAAADRLVSRLHVQLDGIRARVSGRPRPRTILVLERQPNTLRGLYASGGVGFLHEILEVAGGENVFASVERESVQPSHETIIREAPDAVVEIRASASGSRWLDEMQLAWSQLASLPAVRAGRIHLLTGQHLVVPGPRLGDAAEALARVLHPAAFR